MFDIGSGATKTALYLVDIKANKIVDLVGTLTLSYEYQACVTNNNGILSEACMQGGLDIMKSITEFYKVNCNLIKCAGLATAWSRKAFNSLDYINNYLIPNNFHIYPITQLQEGKLDI